MNTDRRTFLKLAGASLLGAGSLPLVEALASGGPRYAPDARALQARRWALAVDTARLQAPGEWEACIAACHRSHNVPAIPTHQDVRWAWTETFDRVFPEQKGPHVSPALQERRFFLLCNHCDNPPCVRVCPTQATFRRKSDGIVMMDYHRCIGCRYCMAACPFGARSFNFSDPRRHLKDVNPAFPTRTKGVVEKCDFCAERLARGQQPACVEASRGALVFGDLADPESAVRRVLRTRHALRRKPHLGTEPQVYYLL